MGAKERKGPIALWGQRRVIVSTISRKGRSPLALLFFLLHLRRPGFPVTTKAEAGRRSLPGSREEICCAERPCRPVTVLSVQSHRWFFLNNFDTQLQIKKKTPVNRKCVRTQCAKAKPVRVFPKTTHPSVVLRDNSGQTSPAASPEMHFRLGWGQKGRNGKYKHAWQFRFSF